MLKIYSSLLLSVVLSAACAKKATQRNPLAKAPPAPPEVIEQLDRNFQRVHFQYDSYVLTEEASKALYENAEILRAYPDLKVRIEGHADERGTEEYNLALGDNRARAVRTYLTRAGVPEKQLETISYGESKPISGEESETAWSLNRRAEFTRVGPFENKPNPSSKEEGAPSSADSKNSKGATPNKLLLQY